MNETAGDAGALELLREQRGRLADRLRPRWWYLGGIGLVWALVFAVPFCSRYLPAGFGTWPVLAAGLAVVGLVQWGQVRVTGVKTGFRNLSYRPGRPAGISMMVVSIATLVGENSLIAHGLAGVAVAVAAIAVAVAVAVQLALLQAVRQDLRDGGAG